MEKQRDGRQYASRLLTLEMVRGYRNGVESTINTDQRAAQKTNRKCEG